VVLEPLAAVVLLLELVLLQRRRRGRRAASVPGKISVRLRPPMECVGTLLRTWIIVPIAPSIIMMRFCSSSVSHSVRFVSPAESGLGGVRWVKRAAPWLESAQYGRRQSGGTSTRHPQSGGCEPRCDGRIAALQLQMSGTQVHPLPATHRACRPPWCRVESCKLQETSRWDSSQ
jgi:hypothetical protein